MNIQFTDDVLYPLETTNQQPKVIHRCGNVYRICGALHLLSIVDSRRVALIGIFGFANRWSEPVDVANGWLLLSSVEISNGVFNRRLAKNTPWEYMGTIDEIMSTIPVRV